MVDAPSGTADLLRRTADVDGMFRTKFLRDATTVIVFEVSDQMQPTTGRCIPARRFIGHLIRINILDLLGSSHR